MRTHDAAFRRLSLILPTAVLCVFVTACTGSTNSQRASHSPTLPAQHTAMVGPSGVSFTASGGAWGAIAISANPLAGQGTLIASHNASTMRFFFSVKGVDGQKLLVGFTHYTGLGTYTVTAGTSPIDTVQVVLGTKQAIWMLTPQVHSACTVMVTSDTVVPGDTASVSGTPGSVKAVDEVKGSMACPAIPPLQPKEPPLQVSDGRFDIFMDQLT